MRPLEVAIVQNTVAIFRASARMLLGEGPLLPDARLGGEAEIESEIRCNRRGAPQTGTDAEEVLFVRRGHVAQSEGAVEILVADADVAAPGEPGRIGGGRQQLRRLRRGRIHAGGSGRVRSLTKCDRQTANQYQQHRGNADSIRGHGSSNEGGRRDGF